MKYRELHRIIRKNGWVALPKKGKAMKTVDVTINVAKDGFYCAYCDGYPTLFGGGKTPDDAVEELKETLRLVKEDCKEAALVYPDWLDDEFVFQTHWDVETMLRYFSGIITPTALGNLSGILFSSGKCP